MKSRSPFLWVGFALLAAFGGCTPSIQTNQVSTSSALVKVECQKTSVQQIVELLRSGRGKDINVVAQDGFCTQVTAAFSPTDTPTWKLGQVLQALNDLPGVLHVEMLENPRPVMHFF